MLATLFSPIVGLANHDSVERPAVVVVAVMDKVAIIDRAALEAVDKSWGTIIKAHKLLAIIGLIYKETKPREDNLYTGCEVSSDYRKAVAASRYRYISSKGHFALTENLTNLDYSSVYP